MSLLKAKGYYKPFIYPFGFDAYKLQNEIHWIPQSISLATDVFDWKHRLTDSERHLITQILRFFTQGDVDIGQAYLDNYIPVFKNEEIRMGLVANAGMESIHAHAYSYLIDSLGLPEVEYRAFQKYEEMKAKHDYLESVKVDSKEDIARSIAIFSGFSEGVQLFSSFAILLNFPRFNKLKGLGQIITYSVRDESHHVDFMTSLFRAYIQENPELWTDSFKGELYEACRDMVNLEDAFIDLSFEQGYIEGLTPEDVKQYIRFIADRRLNQLGLKANYGVEENPLPWLDEMLLSVEHASFFETKATEYVKGGVEGWHNVFGL